MSRLTPYTEQLAMLSQTGRRRSLQQPQGRDFSSNDYLALAGSAVLADIARQALDAGIAHGAGGSRLLGGNHPEHEQLEQFAAAHYGSEAALFFSSGYAANLALFSTLPQRGDLILHDALVHASCHDGMKLGRAEITAFRHNDMNHLEQLIREYRQSGGNGTPWIAVESLYSMDGDRAPLAELAILADRYDAMLVIDEAHAVGIFGEGGKGLSDRLQRRENLVVLRTCGKALGVEGGLINMAATLHDFFINRARPFIFSTAPSPLTAHLVHQAIRHVATHRSLQEELQRLITFAEQQMGRLCPTSRQGSQIFPVIIGEDSDAVAAASALQDAGFDVRAIRPPTVAAGTARLRISLTLNVGEEDVRALTDALKQLQHWGAAA